MPWKNIIYYSDNNNYYYQQIEKFHLLIIKICFLTLFYLEWKENALIFIIWNISSLDMLHNNYYKYISNTSAPKNCFLKTII